MRGTEEAVIISAATFAVMNSPDMQALWLQKTNVAWYESQLG